MRWLGRHCDTRVVTDNESDADLTTHSLAELFSLYRGILSELRRRNVVRTENAPAGDYAEYLVAAAFKGTLATNSEKSYDVISAHGERLQVKARVVSVPPKAGQLQLSPFRSFDFDSAVIVLLSDRDYSVWKAARIAAETVQAAGTYNSHVNGTIVFARPELMGHPDAEDVTEAIRAVQTELVAHAVPADAAVDRSPSVERTLFPPGMTVEIGYTNPNRQTVIEATGRAGSDHYQSVYVLRCGHCGSEYGSNGSDNHRRRCPTCQGGQPGLPYS